MTVQALLAPQRTPGPSVIAATERRLHRRFPIKLIGRFMRADGHEFPCQLRDISIAGLALSSPVQPDIGESVIVHIDELGGLEGTIVRTFDGGFSIALAATRHKSEKLAARITWLINRGELDGFNERGHKRRLPGRNINTLKPNDEVSLQVQVIDVSLSGANVAAEARPPIGSEAYLGKLRAKVARHQERGTAVRFLLVHDADTIEHSFG